MTRLQVEAYSECLFQVLNQPHRVCVAVMVGA